MQPASCVIMPIKKTRIKARLWYHLLYLDIECIYRKRLLDTHLNFDTYECVSNFLLQFFASRLPASLTTLFASLKRLSQLKITHVCVTVLSAICVTVLSATIR